MQFYNIHTHIFTMANAPRRFLELYLPRIVASLIDTITNTAVGSLLVRKGLSFFGDGGRRYASFLQIGKSSSQNDVFRHLIESYEDSSIRMVALTLYMEKLGADASLSGYEGQLEEIIALRKRYPERLLPFFCVDPRWKATGKEIRDTVERYFACPFTVGGKEFSPFVGLKIYPSTGFYAFDQKLKPVMEWAADHQVPVMTHCSYLGGIFNNDADFIKASLNPYDPYAQAYYDMPCVISDAKKARVNNQRSCSYFLEPHSYESMIDYFYRRNPEKPLKICFAHFGSNQHMRLVHKPNGKTAKYYGVLDGINWTAQILDLMKRFPKSVFTDISYSLTDYSAKDSVIYDFIFTQLRDPIYGSNIMFGTDFFMTERESEERKTYTTFKSKALSQTGFQNARNAWEKIAMQNSETYLRSVFYTP